MSLLDWIRDLWSAPVPERGLCVHPYKIAPETERPTQAPPKPSDARQSVAPVWPGPGPVSGAVRMTFWCGHEIHLRNGDYPPSACPVCHSARG